MLDYIGGRRPMGQLRRLLAGLPWYSNFRRAIQDDEETAAAYANSITHLADVGDSGPPQLSQWDEYRELAADITDAIRDGVTQLVSSRVPKGKKRPKTTPVDRPKPAMQRELKRRERELEDQAEADFLKRIGR